MREAMTGVLLAVPPADFVLHNSLFLIAHFHNVIIGGVVFGAFAGINYWFPKAFGFKLDPFWGKLSFWFWVTGFYLAFMPTLATLAVGTRSVILSLMKLMTNSSSFAPAISCSSMARIWPTP